MSESKRGRGRPRTGEVGDRRAVILAAARGQFAAKGFDGVSLRGIAGEAGVDVSLISHYFGDKSRLLVATMELPVNPADKLGAVIAEGTDGLAERLIRTFLEAWDPHSDVFSALVRTTLGSGDDRAPMIQLVRDVLLAALLEVLEGGDRELRAALIATQVLGLGTNRYVSRLGPVADASIDDIVRLYAPGMQTLIT